MNPTTPDTLAHLLEATTTAALRACLAENLSAIPTDIRNTLLTQLRNGMLVGLSDTTAHGTRPGERKARLLLGVLRDRPDDVLRFAHDLKVPPPQTKPNATCAPAKSSRKSPDG